MIVWKLVTILILIDGFLQLCCDKNKNRSYIRHNPYFNRWFSAIYFSLQADCGAIVTILILIDGFLQYIKQYDVLNTEDLSQSLF